jgi:hypothetical protein
LTTGNLTIIGIAATVQLLTALVQENNGQRRAPRALPGGEPMGATDAPD